MTSVWPEIRSIPVGEHPLAWVAQKTRKTCFSRRTSTSSYQPKTNTPLLYDGSTEAKLIIMAILKTYTPQEGLPKEQELTVEPMGTLHHVLDYLKGRDVPLLGMWTLELTGYPDDCQICHGESGGEAGNENLINGIRVCDYCHARMLSGLIDEPTWNGNGPTPYVYEQTKATAPAEQPLVQIGPVAVNEPSSAS